MPRHAASNQKQKQKEPKTAQKRTHTFTGCFTCRRRRVKCDGEKPTCMRCKNARFECLGYGFRFDAPDGVQSNRQRLVVSGERSRMRLLSSSEVDEFLAEIDNASDANGAATRRKGPFAVLSFNSDDQHTHGRNHQNASRQDNGDRSEDQCLMMATTRGRSNNIPPYLAVVNMPSHERELFAFYTAYINTTGPLAHRQTIPMMALTSHVSNWRGLDPNAGAVIFHGVCAFTAKSLALMRPDSQSYRVRAYNHEQLALTGLRSCIQANSSSFLALAAACQTLIICGHQIGRYHDTTHHLAAGINFAVLAVERQSATDSTTASLCEQFLVAVAVLKFEISPHALGCLWKGVDFPTTKRVSPTGIYLPLLHAIIRINQAMPFSHHLSGLDLEELNRLVRAAIPPREQDSEISHAEEIIHHAINLYFARILLHQPPSTLKPLLLSAISHLETLDIPQATNHFGILIWTTSILATCAGEDVNLAERVFAWCRNARRFNQGCLDVEGLVRFSVRLLGMRAEWGGGQEVLGWGEMVARAGEVRGGGRVVDVGG